MNKYGKVVGYKISVQKSVDFLSTNNEISGKELKKTIPFATATKRINNLGTNLTKAVKNLYTENYKTLWTQRNGKIFCVHGLEEYS